MVPSERTARDDQNMSMNPDHISQWKHELREVSAGVYRITLKDPKGSIRYSATGTDENALMEDAQKWLSDISPQAESMRP
jgi:hypothetical protein